MTLELQILGWAVLLAAVQLILYAIPANRELGTEVTAGPRDEGPVHLKGPPGRLQRAFLNHIEGLALFTPAAVVVAVGDASTAFTETCAVVYILARLAYVPAYVTGIMYLRSAVWAVGFLATVLMLLAALL